MKSLQSKMNLGLLLILLCMMSLFSAKTTATCQANFTWSQTTNNVINFTNTSTGTTMNTTYTWYFGDGGTGYTPNPTYTYSVPGTYSVCLVISDSNTCSSYFCDSFVTVYGNVLCVMTASTSTLNASCGTCTDGAASAYSSGGTAPYHYIWSPSGATTQSATNLATGTYFVTITDANNCTATASATIDTCALHASFTWNQPSNNVIDYTNTSTGTNIYTMYEWNYGDGNYGYTANTSHTYSNPGTYYPCLAITDSANMISCTNTYCTTITVTGVNCNNLSINSTTTNSSCATCATGSMVTTTTGGTSPFTYVWTPNVSSNSSVYGLLPGSYTCCVSDAMGCTACTTGYVDSTINNTFCGASFYLYPDSMTAHHYWAVNSSYGTPPLTYSWNWGDSTFSTGPYPQHTYANAGIYTICLMITDSTGCTNTTCVTDSIQRTKNAMVYINVISPQMVGIKEVTSINSWSVFPNPVANSMTINYDLANTTKVMINVYDMIGNKVAGITNTIQLAGPHSILWDATTVPQGVYLMQLKTDTKTLNQKITIMR